MSRRFAGPRRAGASPASYVALAFVATLLLSYATVQSVVMQAVMAAGFDMPSMPGMQHDAPAAKVGDAAAQHHHMDGMDMSHADMAALDESIGAGDAEADHGGHEAMHGDHAMHMAAAAPAGGEHAHHQEPAPAAPSGKTEPAAASGDPCAFCQAAAHAPLVSVALPLALPSAVAYLPPLPAETPRAPGLWRDKPKARGPPILV